MGRWRCAGEDAGTAGEVIAVLRFIGTSVEQIERFYARNLPLSAEMARNLQSFDRRDVTKASNPFTDRYRSAHNYKFSYRYQNRFKTQPDSLPSPKQRSG